MSTTNDQIYTITKQNTAQCHDMGNENAKWIEQANSLLNDNQQLLIQILKEIKNTDANTWQIREYLTDVIVTFRIQQPNQLLDMFQQKNSCLIFPSNKSAKSTTFLCIMQFVQFLSLTSTGITNISSLSHLQNLKHLFLANTNIRCLCSLQYLTNIETLNLQNNQVDSLKYLLNMKKLHTLQTQNTKLHQQFQVSIFTNCKSVTELFSSYQNINKNEEKFCTCNDYLGKQLRRELSIQKIDAISQNYDIQNNIEAIQRIMKQIQNKQTNPNTQRQTTQYQQKVQQLLNTNIPQQFKNGLNLTAQQRQYYRFLLTTNQKENLTPREVIEAIRKNIIPMQAYLDSGLTRDTMKMILDQYDFVDKMEQGNC